MISTSVTISTGGSAERNGPSAVPRDGLENQRTDFVASIEIERLHFGNMSVALARAHDDPSAIFEELHAHAHRLHRDALIFELSKIVATASALERAALSASKSHAENTDAAVWKALVNLVGLFAAMGAKGPMPRWNPAGAQLVGLRETDVA